MTEFEECFRGLRKTSLIDFPGMVSCVLFVGGCNFRCPYCHNGSLVERMEPRISWDEVFSFLHKRKSVIDGVCVSGGEPTVAPFLLGFLREVKSLGFKLKLDTNGYEPTVLAEALSGGLLDYVAMDVKNGPGQYGVTSGRSLLDLGRIKQSISLLQESRVNYEFRTTVSEELTSLADIRALATFVGSGERYVLQTVDSGRGTLSGHTFTPPTEAALEEMKSCLLEVFGQVVVR